MSCGSQTQAGRCLAPWKQEISCIVRGALQITRKQCCRKPVHPSFPTLFHLAACARVHSPVMLDMFDAGHRIGHLNQTPDRGCRLAESRFGRLRSGAGSRPSVCFHGRLMRAPSASRLQQTQATASRSIGTQVPDSESAVSRYFDFLSATKARTLRCICPRYV